MKSALCSSPLDLTNVCPQAPLCNTANSLLSKPFIGVGLLRKVKSVDGSHCSGKTAAVSCHLMPGHLEGSFMGKKRLEESSRKVDYVRTLLIDNYDSYTYNIYQELSVVNGVPPVVVKNNEWTWEELFHCLYHEKLFDNIVISPGPGSPTCAADVGICLRLLLECRDIPILGVCLGHQALGYVHGAQIVHAPEPVHGRMSEIEHNGCRLFRNIPSGTKSGFKVVRYHSLVIDANSLPEEFLPIAWTTSAGLQSFVEFQKPDIVPDACDRQIRSSVTFDGPSCSFSHTDKLHTEKVLMGIKHSTRPHYGLQFHPESIATCHGRQIFQNFREVTVDYWKRSKEKFNACMQVPGVSQVLGIPQREISRCNEDMLSYRGNLLEDMADKNGFRMFHFPGTSVDKRHLRLKWKRLHQLAARVGGARNIFCELFGANGAEDTFWLDSSSVEKKRARFSIMGGKGGSLWKQMTFKLSDESSEGLKNGGQLSIQDAQGSTTSMYLEKGFLDFLNQELLSFSYDEKDFEGLPFDFYGGYIGYIGYDLKVECGMSSNRHKSTAPDACFFFTDRFVVIDHRYNDVYIMSVQDENTTHSPWLDDVEHKLLQLEASNTKNPNKQISLHSPSLKYGSRFSAVTSRDQYIENVHKCLEYIRDGESYELCLTTQIRKQVKGLDSLGLYLHLRDRNPAPYAAWLNFASDKLCICSSSPERFLRLDRNGVLEAKPIKGTIARGSTEEEDELNKLQLQYSEKDQAENLMIVDLLRNDLGRVCEPGSVHVPRLMEVESYATVHTMVSTIRGKKRSNMTAIDCVRAAFPGGSMTGAPKLRSMEILDSLESCARGVYSGSIGFFSYNQTFDLNIVIRTVVVHGDQASIGAGGAIVALSKPEDEYDEMLLKTRAPAQAVVDFQ